MYDEVCSAFEQEIRFIIGRAGTGKSTRLASMYAKDTLVLTPTHKAVTVLNRKGIEQAFTIHSVLKLIPTLDKNYNPTKGHKMQRLKKLGGVDLKDIKQVFLDEYSMIPTSILDLLLEVLPAEAVVTIFGDYSQLPPVDGDPVIPEDYSDNIEVLDTQYRADAPEVVETFERFVDYIESPRGGKDLTMNQSIPAMALLDAMKKYDYDPEQDMILCYTNAEVIRLNDIVSKYVGNTELDEVVLNALDGRISDAEPLHKVYPSCVSKGKLVPEKYEEVEADIEKWNTHIEYDTCNVVIDDETYEVYFDLEHYANSKQMKAEVEKWQRKLYNENSIPEGTNLAKWCGQNRHIAGVSERAKAWSAYLTHQNLVFDMREPFARTVHKAQGSEYRRVYIAKRDIEKSVRGNYYETYARLMYVALSRAINGVVIIK